MISKILSVFKDDFKSIKDMSFKEIYQEIKYAIGRKHPELEMSRYVQLCKDLARFDVPQGDIPNYPEANEFYPAIAYDTSDGVTRSVWIHKKNGSFANWGGVEAIAI